MTQTGTPTDTRALLIKKLLNKAEARGTTPQERDTYNAKATQLMVQWGIEEALLADADRAKVENIVKILIEHSAPKSYSYEITLVGIEVANQLSCRGFLQRHRDGRTNLTVVGFESDVEHVRQIFMSLVIQCQSALGYEVDRNALWTGMSGTEKFNWKRSFIRGFANAIGDKLRAIRAATVADAAPGTDLVLVDRTKKVDGFIAETMQIGRAVARRYGHSGHEAGNAAGMRANVGQSGVGGSRSAIGG